jgi:uncharacterized protein
MDGNSPQRGRHLILPRSENCHIWGSNLVKICAFVSAAGDAGGVLPHLDREKPMLRTVVGLAMVLLPIIAAQSTSAVEFGTREEAKAMVRRVQEKFKRDGAEATFRAITQKSKAFHDRDLYPFVYDLAGVNMAHGARSELVGKNLIDFKDQNGKFLIREMIELVNDAGDGWVNYRWANPTTNVIEDKSAYVKKMGKYFVGVGIYQAEQMNESTVAIVSGSPDSDDTSLQMAYDLAAALNDTDNLRIVPVVGIGGAQNIRDVRGLNGVDLGLTQTSILNDFRRSDEQLGSYDNKIVYITKLFYEEAHLLVRNDITSFEQLRDQRINFDEIGSGTNYSMRDVFKRMNMRIQEVNLPQVDAIEKLKSGEIAATVLIAGKPARLMSSLKLEDGLHLLPIAYSGALGSDYLPAELTHDDYPDLVPLGDSIDTIAVGTVLIARNWPKSSDRYNRIEKFVNAFFSRLPDLQRSPRHAKWREVSLTSKLAGWTRFEPAEAWLDSHQLVPDRSQFDTFLASRRTSASQATAQISSQDQQQLFQSFLEWLKVQKDTKSSNAK